MRGVFPRLLSSVCVLVYKMYLFLHGLLSYWRAKIVK